ncbi:M14 family zinc carboxypeptidase [Bacillus sp. SA1-12]|uniref:M14 family zinc carboxypeptidase n=1 Tax=Bacillus sp. SA1-12 TaxID=1455638 RepID=UPI0018CCE6B6|nr:M14 family zinc carboxypeptidase [Bacillus sp. SA1-12]
MLVFLGINQSHGEAVERYTYESMKNELFNLAETYQLELKTIGHSEFGRELLAVKVGHGNHSIFISGSTHGREWLTTHIIMNMIEEYAKAYDHKKLLYGNSLEVLDQISIWFVPMVNPDGVTIQQEGIKGLPFFLQEVYFDMNKGRKGFSRWKANGLGVDLNRQYPAGWERIKGNQNYASYSRYKGQKPLEAKEAKALVSFTEQIQPLIAASYHTSGQMIYWYYFNELEHLFRDYQMIEQVANATGYEISYPPANAVGGGYTDWFIQRYKRPALTIEVSPPYYETSPPLSVLEEEWERNKEVGLILAEYAESEFLK